MTHIYAKRDMDCPFSATIDFFQRLDKDHSVGPFAGIRARVECQFEEVRDHTDEARRHQALALHWKAPSRAPLPLMNGLITVRPAGPKTELRMEGSYVPPLGLLGKCFDLLIGRFIAQRTVNRFLSDLCDFVNAAWATERREYAQATLPSSESSTAKKTP